MSTVSESPIQKNLKVVFKKYDSNGDGKLSHDDVYKFLQDTLEHIGKNRDTSETEVDEFIDRYDLNRDREINELELEKLIQKILTKKK